VAKKPAAKKPPCMVRGCKLPQRTRGMCDPCYHSALSLIKSGEKTWDDFIKAGEALPAKRAKAPKTALMKRYRKSKASS
jgi:hypothetical protein